MKALLLAGALALSFVSVADARSHHSDYLSNDRHYTNVSGHRVHSPAYTSNGHRPRGASAKCGDGTWSFSEHHRGTCSSHGGVAEWLR